MSESESPLRKRKSHRRDKKEKKRKKEKRKRREKEKRKRKEKRQKRSRGEDEEYALAQRIRKEVASKKSEPMFTFMDGGCSLSAPLVPLDVPIAEEKPKRRVAGPISDQEYEKQRNTFKMVFDPQSGRTRCVNGTGEIVERIVSREEHKRLNYIATHHPFNPL